MITYSMLGNYGRLGNQLWQIASTIGIAVLNNQEYTFPEWQYNDKLVTPLPNVPYPSVRYRIYEEQWPFAGVPKLRHSDIDLMGYWQSYKYFDEASDIIKKALTFNIETNDANLDYVAIHVRRGDYLGYQNIHPIPPLSYYTTAMDLFPSGTKFDIFSDDVTWCMYNFDHDRCNFILPSDPLIDLLYMSRHSAVIVANSSFSWWAGYLSGKAVISPKIWTTVEPIESMADRIPAEWTILDYA